MPDVNYQLSIVSCQPKSGKDNLKTYGTWDLLEVRDIDRLEEKILEKVY